MSQQEQSIQFTLKLTILAPFLSHKAGAQHFGYDMSMLKDAQDNPVFLGSLIRGNLKHALLHFKKTLNSIGDRTLHDEIAQVIRWFGEESDSENNKPQRANFKFDFYWKTLQNNYPKNEVPRYRIGIDEKTGTVEQGNLQVIEAPFRQGQAVKFTGHINAQLNPDKAKIAKKWLHKAASYLTALGALKGTGFGQLKAVELQQTPLQTETKKNPITADRIGICLSLDRPLCIAKPHIPDHNRFSSEEFIPGNAIIGSIAQQYPSLSKEDWFNQLRVTHALPAAKKQPERAQVLPPSKKQPKRTPALPLSLATIKINNEKRVIDLALSKPDADKAILIEIGSSYHSPTYQPDWKDADKTLAYQQANQADDNKALPKQHEITRQLIVRTAIEEGQTSAKEGALFSLDCVSEEQTQWCADIDFSNISAEKDRQQAKVKIATVIENGLQGIGKTKANASLSLQKSFCQSLTIDEIKPDKKGYYIITLQTPARLFAIEIDNPIKATADAKSLFKCYQDYWGSISGQKLKLSHYFAQQSKVGGEFYWRYYQQNLKYQPQWLTTAGSVFVLSLDEAAEQKTVAKELSEWLKHGLPQAPDKKHSSWNDNPYIKENGFGEIRLNDAAHFDLSLETQQIKGVWL